MARAAVNAVSRCDNKPLPTSGFGSLCAARTGAGGVPERHRQADEPRRIRVHPGQARTDSRDRLSFAGGRSISPHQLRHSCAVTMLQATGDIRKVALWLGHADVRTTEVYLRVDPTAKLEAVEAVLPPQLRRGRFKPPDELISSLLAPG